VSIYALKSRFQGLLRPAVRGLYRIGVTANQVTVTACLVSVAIGFALAFTPALMLDGAPRIWFAVVPVWMFLRMALNAVDGMLAREFGQKSALGAYLNELSDVVSDAALYLPFAFVPPFDWRSVGAVIFLSTLTEMAGVVAVMIGAPRRYDGPMGKSDRAFVFSLLAIAIAATAALPPWANWVMWGVAALAAATVVNRIRSGLHEAGGSWRPHPPPATSRIPRE
jgi:CDP-diacylglycerol--glycerol-3-phosphate 3-phosphatidyltransferase